MPQLLLELGTEELPASAVRRAFRELASRISATLVKESVLGEDATVISMGTPRRLIVGIDGVSEGQPDSEKSFRGPAIKGAFDAAGRPTPACLGFCKGQGIDPSDLWRDEQYVWVTKKLVGRGTLDLLSEVLPAAIRSLTFDKTMRWGTSKLRFARPIRWILATLDSTVVPFDLEGVVSSSHSFGHRFYDPGQFEALTLNDLISGLRERKVEPDPEIRRTMILEKLPTSAGEIPEISDALLDENVFLTEWPTPIEGSFLDHFLGLPTPVLTTVMAKHEKMFPVRDESGSILPKFIFVRNSGRDENVRAGAEWVLNARMNDAKFFFDEDFRTDLDGFLDRTKTIVFQEKLGTVFGRSGRLANLASACAPLPVDSQQELELAGLAGKYAKADLSTGLVSELASLQGVVGGIYAARTGLPEEVSFAISSQYLAALPSPEDANGRTAVRLILADQLDKLAGYLGIGLEPSGSSDPYGLRRSVGQLIEAGWAWPQALRPFSELLEVALEGYAADGLRLDPNAAVQSLSRLFVGRYGHLLADVRHDILEAVTSSATLEALTSPKLIRLRAKVLTELASNEPFVQAATRPLNILAAARKKGYEFDADVELSEQDLNSRSGLELHKVAAQISQELDHALAGEKVDEVVGLLLKLEGPINYFFEETMVMAEDPVARKARLSLVARVSHLLLKMGDFTKVTFAGTA